MTEESEELKAVRESYINDLRNGLAYSIGKFDDQVLFISSGALVLSLNFIKDIVSLDQALYLWILYTSWGVLGLTVMISVTSHLVSYHLTERQIKRAENKDELKDDKITIWFNYIMAIALVIGIAFQIFFVIINVNQMTNKKPTNINEVQGNSQNATSKEAIIEKAMPVAKVPQALQKPDTSTQQTTDSTSSSTDSNTDKKQ